MKTGGPSAFAGGCRVRNKALALLLMTSVLAGCRHQAETGVIIRASARVDGSPIVARTVWQTRMVDTFPQNGRLELTGASLRIPLPGGDAVYGLIRSVTGDNLDGGSSLAFVPRAMASAEERLAGRWGGPQYATPATEYGWAARKMAGRAVPICLKADPLRIGQDRCMVFIHYGRSDDPSSLEMLRPGEETSIRGHRFVIDRVTVTLTGSPVDVPASQRMLPPVRYTRADGFGRLPDDLTSGEPVDFVLPIQPTDFWSER